MLAAAFAMLASTRQIDFVTFGGYVLALGAGFVFDGRELWPVSRRLSNWLRIGYLPFFVFDWQILGSPPAVAVIRFVLFASACKLVVSKTSRDWLWLYLIAFLEVVLAAGMMVSATFFLLLIVFLFFAISALVTFEMRNAGVESSPPDARMEFWRETSGSRRVANAPRARLISVFAGAALLLILFLSAPLFLAMPRLHRSPVGGRLLRTEALSGFSTTVRLGDVAQVKLNPQVVMRVRVRFPPAQGLSSLRWRGVTFDEYDGQTWIQTGIELQPLRRVGDNIYEVDRQRQRGGLTGQSFVLEPLDPATIFAATRPIFVRDLATVQRDGGDGLWTDPHPAQRLAYTVYSDTRVTTEVELQGDTSRIYPPEIRRRYTQQPLVRDRRIDDLAEEITRAATTPYEIARRIEQHMKTSYDYTLDLSRIGDTDPLADFLFEVRAGHCEFFATAMVMLMRARRIPARLVNGFQMGEYSEVSDSFTVRQSDAHSWVEVYFANHGWVAFDPTPPAGLSNYDDGLIARLRQYFEGLEMFWQERVVGFGPGEQLAMFVAFQQSLTSFERGSMRGFITWASGVAKSVESAFKGDAEVTAPDESAEGKGSGGFSQIASHPIFLVFVALCAIGLGAMEWRRWAKSWRRLARRDGRSSAVAFYHEMSRTLERSGIKRGPEATPREFARTVGLLEVEELTRKYEHARYSSTPLTPEEVTRISILLKSIKQKKIQGSVMQVQHTPTPDP